MTYQQLKKQLEDLLADRACVECLGNGVLAWSASSMSKGAELCPGCLGTGLTPVDPPELQPLPDGTHALAVERLGNGDLILTASNPFRSIGVLVSPEEQRILRNYLTGGLP